MCATKPSMSWPHSPSRSSSSDWALLGIRSSPRHGLAPGTSSGRLACGVIAIGRVCGTAIGTEPIATTRVTPQPLEDLADRAGERLPAVVGLRPVQQEVRRAAAVVQQPYDQPRGVVGLVVVAHERHRRPAGAVVVELVDVEGRHHRTGPRAAGVEVGEVPGGVRRGVAGVEEPVEDQHHRQVGDPRQLGDLVDDVHEPCRWAPVQFLRRPTARRHGVRRCRSSRPGSAGRAAARPSRPSEACSSAGSPSSSSSASSSSACDIRLALGRSPAIRSHGPSPSSPRATWVGCAQLTRNQSGPPAASTSSIASRSEVPPASRPSVSTVNATADREPDVARGGHDAERLVRAGQRERRWRCRRRRAWNDASCGRW